VVVKWPYIEWQTIHWPSEKGQKEKQWSTEITTQKTKDWVIQIPLKAEATPLFAPVVLLMLRIWWKVLNEEIRTGYNYDKWNIVSGHLWHRYYVTIKQIMMAPINFWSNNILQCIKKSNHLVKVESYQCNDSVQREVTVILSWDCLFVTSL